ncbi:MAG: hypothetical protein LBK76_04055 [Verrucomicrobiales bacterium]|jgi:hypothetical protein|nr:hypothetical protein [Verrucomicrobiales bacterium]
MKKPIAKNQATKLTKPVTVSGRLDAGVLTRKDAPEISPAAAESRAIIKALDNGADLEMGLQLTAQYQRAIGGMTEVLKFGALMMRLREYIDTKNLNSTRGVKLPRGTNAADGGIKAWLKRYAPQVKEATAYRFLHVAEAVLADFRNQLPAKISFVELATADADQLPNKYKKKQLELWEFVNGTSQRSWLDRFRPYRPTGGKRVSTKEPLTVAEELAAKHALGQTVFTDLCRHVDDFFTDEFHLHLSNDLIVQLEDLFRQALEKLKNINRE